MSSMVALHFHAHLPADINIIPSQRGRTRTAFTGLGRLNAAGELHLYVCVCVCVYTHKHTHYTHTHTHTRRLGSKLNYLSGKFCVDKAFHYLVGSSIGKGW